MCGINGIIYFDSHSDKSESFFRERIQVMNDEIAHRGPDGEGILIKYPACLGHRRLSIIDLSEKANQPMFNEDNTIAIIYNGEIYNYLELIPDLKNKGHLFKTRSDTEVILHSYEEYGFDCVKKFNGMWAFGIYDFRKSILFCSRDRFGVKPFYYYFDKQLFIFSSEIKAILKVKKIKEANYGKVYDYLAYGYNTSNGDTFFKDIYELKPAHSIIVKNDKFDLKKYWDFKRVSVENADDMLTQLLYDSVRLRFRSDVPVSILLSGGLDSSIITKITDELIDNGELSNKNVTAYSAIFPGFIYDESNQIKEFLKTCEHINSKMINPVTNSLIDSINCFVYGMGEPVFSMTSFAHYAVMKEIKNHNVKVVLNGQGSDEAWCGYDKYIIGYFLLDLFLTRPQEIISQMNSISDKMKLSYQYIILQTIKAMLTRRFVSYLRSKQREKVLKILSKNFRKENYTYFRNPEYKKLDSNNLSSYLKFNIQYQGFNQILHYEDHSSMMNSIEIRSPFIDYRLMELAFSLPSQKKIDNGITKKILREVFESKLPQSILTNYCKIGFVTPFENWLKQNGTKKFLEKIVNSDSFNEKKIWYGNKVRKIFTNEINYPSFPFWRIINLELWSQLYEINNL